MPHFDLILDDNTHDLVIGEQSKDLELVTRPKLIAQLLLIKLRAQFGEWLLDTSFGINYLENIFVKGPDLTTIGAEFRAAIITVDGVAQITSFELELTGRTLNVTFEVTTEEEDEVLEAVVQADTASGALVILFTSRGAGGVLSWTVS